MLFCTYEKLFNSQTVKDPERPAFLFYLASSGKHILSLVDSHLCNGDTYFGQVHLDRYTLRLNWWAIGPNNDEEIDDFYS